MFTWSDNDDLLKFVLSVSDKDFKPILFKNIEINEPFYLEKSNEVDSWYKRIKPFKKMIN